MKQSKKMQHVRGGGIYIQYTYVPVNTVGESAPPGWLSAASLTSTPASLLVLVTLRGVNINNYFS